MKTIVVKNIPRGPGGICASLGASGVATVHEAMGRTGLMQPHMRPIHAESLDEL